MEDILYCSLVVAFLGATWGMVELFDRLSRSGS